MGVIYKPFVKTIPDDQAFQPIQLSLPIHQLPQFSDLYFESAISDEEDDTKSNTIRTITFEQSVPTQKSFDKAKELIKKRGQHQYKTSDINVGNMKDFLDLAESEGISFRITSGLRRENTGSNHYYGNAIDITPIEGQTWNDLIYAMKSSDKLRKYMKDKKMRILDERSKAVLEKTKGTGAHFHISFGNTEGVSADDFFV